MNNILMRSGKDPYEIIDPFVVLNENILGTNSGNLIYAHAMHKIMGIKDVEITPIYRHSENQADMINEKYDYFIIPLANAFRVTFQNHIITLTKLIKKLKIPVIITGDATYYKNGFAIEPRNLNEYQIIIKDIHQIQSLNHKQIEKAKLFAYYENNLSRVESKLNSYTNTVKLSKDDNYWNNLSNNLKGFNFNECKFYKMLKVMIKNKDYNIIDYDII